MREKIAKILEKYAIWPNQFRLERAADEILALMNEEQGDNKPAPEQPEITTGPAVRPDVCPICHAAFDTHETWCEKVVNPDGTVLGVPGGPNAPKPNRQCDISPGSSSCNNCKNVKDCPHGFQALVPQEESKDHYDRLVKFANNTWISEGHKEQASAVKWALENLRPEAIPKKAVKWRGRLFSNPHGVIRVTDYSEVLGGPFWKFIREISGEETV